MSDFTLDPYRLAVNVEGTRAYYAAHPLPWVTCDCAGCRNFLRAIKTLPPAAAEFFASLGLDPEKPGETMYYTGTPESVSGSGWYHLAGEISEGGRSRDEGLPVGPRSVAGGLSASLLSDGSGLLPALASGGRKSILS